MTGKIFLKLIVGIFGLLLIALATVDYFATDVAKESYIQNLKDQLAGKCRMLALSIATPESLDADHARAMAGAAGGRVTIIRADGKVLVDSEAKAAEMENHRTRPEVMQAFASGVGSDSRQSATIGVKFLYVAVRVADASAIIREHPTALQLRFLQTLTEMASENNSTTVFPIPVDLITPFLKGLPKTS